MSTIIPKDSELAKKIISIAAEIAKQHPDNECVLGRLRRGTCLVLNGAVDGNTVKSQAIRGQVYQIGKTITGLSCTCSDWAGARCFSDYGRDCKHTMAWRLVYLAGAERCEMCDKPATVGEYCQFHYNEVNTPDNILDLINYEVA